MKVLKSPDAKAAEIRFGIEIETVIPRQSGIGVGPYHRGTPVTTAYTTGGRVVQSPHFQGSLWRADRDSSIQVPLGCQCCEFVSPVLYGDEGVEKLAEFLAFANLTGAAVNNSCGLHITVGIESVIGTREPAAIADFCKRLARHAHEHQWAIYSQTGAGRHLVKYAHQISEAHDQYIDQLRRAAKAGNSEKCVELARQAGRGMVNFGKAFRAQPAVEFRAFASTLNEKAVFHHLATVLGLVRKTVVTPRVPSFHLCKRQTMASSEQALRRMWHLFGWRTSESNKSVEVALGAFGPLHQRLPAVMDEAALQAEKFERHYPAVFAQRGLSIPRPVPAAQPAASPGAESTSSIPTL